MKLTPDQKRTLDRLDTATGGAEPVPYDFSGRWHDTYGEAWSLLPRWPYTPANYAEFLSLYTWALDVGEFDWSDLPQDYPEYFDPDTGMPTLALSEYADVDLDLQEIYEEVYEEVYQQCEDTLQEEESDICIVASAYYDVPGLQGLRDEDMRAFHRRVFDENMHVVFVEDCNEYVLVDNGASWLDLCRAFLDLKSLPPVTAVKGLKVSALACDPREDDALLIAAAQKTARHVEQRSNWLKEHVTDLAGDYIARTHLSKKV